MWIDKPNGTKKDHWIDLIWVDNEIERDYWWMECSVKWDGCIHLWQASNIPFDLILSPSNPKREEKGACDDYIHICNIDSQIKILTELKKIAKAHFKDKDEWNPIGDD